jgi:FAD/FMN-containing dehydrogenase
VDPDRRTARVGGGALLGDFDHAAHAYGLATPAGFFSTTGVGGLTLGGGIAAYLGRQHGMTCDNLLSADVITADGDRVVASEDRNPDLFWALRGGGGNFGVVTSFEFRLHPVDQVIGGPMVFDADGADDVLRFYDRYVQEAPRELGGFCALDRAPALPFVPEDMHGEPTCLVVVSWNGPAGAADEAFAPLREAGPLVGEHVGPVPYPALQQAFDEELPPGLHHYWKSDYVAALTGESVEAHVEHALRMPPGFTTMHLYPMNGAVHDVEEDATAFAFRDARFAAVIVGATEDPDRADDVTAWVRDYYSAIHPWSGYEGGYTNYASPDDAGRVRDNLGSSYDRLARIKAHWDPDNLFRINQNIEPAA